MGSQWTYTFAAAVAEGRFSSFEVASRSEGEISCARSESRLTELHSESKLGLGFGRNFGIAASILVFEMVSDQLSLVVVVIELNASSLQGSDHSDR